MLLGSVEDAVEVTADAANDVAIWGATDAATPNIDDAGLPKPNLKMEQKNVD